jgi:hypothetical protein
MAKRFAYFEKGTPVNALNATNVLTLTGVVIDGQKVTINNPAFPGTDTYEFIADTALTKSNPANIVVDINSVTTKSTGSLTVGAQPTAGDTMTIGTKVYTFVAVGADNADGKISVGADLAGAKLAIVAAINATDTHSVAHSFVKAGAFVADVCTITAKVGGVAGDAVATTETFASASNFFGAATLGSGADCTATNAVTALVAAVEASDTQRVAAADGAGDTVVFTADIAGEDGNHIAASKVMTNGSFAGTYFTRGVNGTIAVKETLMLDSTYLYVCVADNTHAGKNWRRISIGSAF